MTVQRPSGKTETLAVKIPPGIEDGKKIRIRGQGQPAPRGGTPGDILLTVRRPAAPVFPPPRKSPARPRARDARRGGRRRQGRRADAASETVTLSVPPGTSSGAKLRVKGHGVAPKNGAARRSAGRDPNRSAQTTQRCRPARRSSRSTSTTVKTHAATCVGDTWIQWTSDFSRTTASGEAATFSGRFAGG